MNESVEREWSFTAKDQSGRQLSGTVQAASAAEARMILLEQRLDLVKLESGESALMARLRGAVDPRALTVFTRQFATLIDAALPLLSALRMLAELTRDRALKNALHLVWRDVNGGSSLSDALQAHPKVFPPIYVHMVEAGEVGGSLPESLDRVADHMEAAQALRDRLIAAMIYPAVVLSVAVLAVIAILTFVVPVFAELFSAEGVALPRSTQILMSASAVAVSYWHVLLGGIMALVVLVSQGVGTEVGRRWVDYVALRLPLIGGLTRKASVARFTRAMASMLHSGVTLSEALRASARISGNTEVEYEIMAARDAIQAGSDLSTPLSRSQVLPPLLSQMVKVGEESGRLDQMLNKVADFFEMEVRTAIDGTMKAVEPALIVILGVVLGGIVVAMYTPVFDLMTSL